MKDARRQKTIFGKFFILEELEDNFQVIRKFWWVNLKNCFSASLGGGPRPRTKTKFTKWSGSQIRFRTAALPHLCHGLCCEAHLIK